MARRTKEQLAEAKTEKQIESAWYRLASGVEVDIMDLGKIYRDAKLELADGASLDDAVKTQIARYRKN